MLQAFNLDAASTNTTVTLTNDSTKLTCQVEPAQPDHHRRPRGDGRADARLGTRWRDAKNALGAPFNRRLHHQRDRRPLHADARRSSRAKFLDLRHHRDRPTTAADIDAGPVLDFTTLKDTERRQLPRRRRHGHLAGRPHLRQLPQPGALVHDDPRAGTAALRDVASGQDQSSTARAGMSPASSAPSSVTSVAPQSIAVVAIRRSMSLFAIATSPECRLEVGTLPGNVRSDR